METTQGAEVAQTNPQPELSIEDRILNAMGEDGSIPEFQDEPVEIQEEAPEETPEADATEEPSEDEDYVELELDGDIYQVPKKLQEGYLRQQDYTRKTQEVAAERQQVQEQRQAIEAERQAFQNQVQAQQQNFQLYAQVASIDNQIAQYERIDWQQLIDSDPVEAVKLDRTLRDLKESRNYLLQESAQQQQQIQQYQAQQYSQLLEQGKAELAKAIPDWSAEKAKAISNFSMETYGFTQEEIKSVLDPRHVRVLNDAMKYRELMASKPEVTKKVSTAPKIVKSGAQQPKQSNADVLRKIAKTSTDKSARNNAIQRLLEGKLG